MVVADKSVGERPLEFGVALVCSGKRPETRIFVVARRNILDLPEKEIAGRNKRSRYAKTI